MSEHICVSIRASWFSFTHAYTYYREKNTKKYWRRDDEYRDDESKDENRALILICTLLTMTATLQYMVSLGSITLLSEASSPRFVSPSLCSSKKRRHLKRLNRRPRRGETFSGAELNDGIEMRAVS